MRINEFILRDVRCFEGEQKFNIRPLTFLVGENSTGKSTMLGCFQALNNALHSDSEDTIDFNSPPYEMGVFTDIARKTKTSVEEFALGYNLEYDKDKILQYLITFYEKEDSSEPAISSIGLQLGKGKITFKQKESHPRDIGITLRKNKDEFIISINLQSSPVGLELILFFLGIILEMRYERNQVKASDAIWKEFRKFLETNKPSPISRGWKYRRILPAYSIVPIRSEPQQTYNTLNTTQTPQDGEIPMLLMNLYRSNQEGWKDLRKQLVDFGKSSGLFSDISVKNFDNSSNSPFRLQIKVNGPKSNLMDVGYGISQVLPILVRVLNDEEELLLMQQPEVHLHPKGQAALTSLLVESIKNYGKTFILETHSDYMIDRARVEIMKGNIPHKDVSLIYLEAVKNKVLVHNISFDKNAELENVPSGYRDFFQKEMYQLLGFKDT